MTAWVPENEDSRLADIKNEGLHDSLARILGTARVRAMGPDEPAFYKCKCQDTGVVAMTSGRFDVASDPNRKNRHVFVDASPERPVYVRCEKCNPKKPEGEKERGRGSY